MLALLDRGLVLFAIPPGERGAPRGPRTLLATAEQVRANWRGGDNPAVACRPSRLVVFDLDRKHGVDGPAQFRRLCVRLGVGLPVTLTVATRTGLHVYFRVHTRDRFVSLPMPAPGVELRTPGLRRGGHVLAPGAVVDGVRYTVALDAPIAALPAPLAAVVPRAGE